MSKLSNNEKRVVSKPNFTTWIIFKVSRREEFELNSQVLFFRCTSFTAKQVGEHAVSSYAQIHPFKKSAIHSFGLLAPLDCDKQDLQGRRTTPT